MGFLRDILRMTERYDYSLRFFRRFYRPDNCTLFVVGDFDPRKTLDLIRRAYGSWSGKTEAAPIPTEPPQRKETRKHIDWETETKARLLVGYHTPSLGSDLGAAAVQNVLGPYLFGESSPLYQDLVLRRQLAESIRSQYVDTRDPRLFYYLVTLKDEGALAEVEKTVARAIRDVAAGKVDRKRLAGVKSNLRYGLVMYMETPGRIAEVLSLLTTPTGDPHTLHRLYERIAGVTAARLAAFARKYLRKANRTVVTLTGKPRAKG
jgi:zinc protease